MAAADRRTQHRLPSILFVTPAHGRLALTDLCLAHRQWTIHKLAERGIRAHQVVIACDENIDTAMRYEYAVVNRDNSHLGQRWNDGYEYAAKHGYTHIAPIGSDSWVHPDYFDPLTDAAGGVILTSHHYTLIDEDGVRCAHTWIEPAGGVGPHTFPTHLIARSRNRPVRETLDRGCDHSLLTTIRRTNRQTKIEWQWRDLFPTQYIGFRSHEQQLNPYDTLADRYATEQHTHPWDALREHHPEHLVTQAEALYSTPVAA